MTKKISLLFVGCVVAFKIIGAVEGEMITRRANTRMLIDVKHPIRSGELKQALFINQKPQLDGTIYDERPGTGTPRPIQPGRAYLFDGTNDYVDCGNDPSLRIVGDLTMCVWINPDTLGVSNRIIAHGADGESEAGNFLYIMHLANGVVSYFHEYGAGNNELVSFSASVAASTWTHLATVRDDTSKEVTLYVNGVFSETTPYANSTTGGASGRVDIGRLPQLADYFDGKMSDVRVYDKALTADEVEHVQTFGKSGTDPTTTNLVGHWKCDDTSTTTAYDSSGNGNHGTKTNITPATFHYEGGDVPYSYQNEVGYNPGMWFDGTNDYVEFPDITSLASRTVEIWFEYSSSTTEHDLVLIATGTRYLTATMNSNRDGSVDLVATTGNVPGQTDENSLSKNTGFTVGQIYKLIITTDANEDISSATLDGVAMTDTAGKARIDIINYPQHRLGARVIGSFEYGGVLRYYSVDNFGTYDFIDNTNSAVLPDTSGNGNIGTISGANFISLPRDESDTSNDVTGLTLDYTGQVPRNAKLVESNCGTFDGVDDYVDLDGTTMLGNARSFCVRVKSNQVDTLKYLFDASPTRHVIAWNSTITGQLGYYSGSFWVNFGDAPADGDWHTVVCVIDGTTARCYVDGSQLGSDQSVESISLSSATSMKIAALFNGPASRFQGQLCDVRMYNKALTSSEVTHYDTLGVSGTDPTNTNLIFQLPLSEGAGTIAYDRSGNGNHGTITNATEAAFWGTLQDEYHGNIAGGFSLYEHATADPIYVPYDVTASPLSITTPTGYAKTYDAPSGPWHNGAESKIDFTGGVASPGTSTWEQAWTAGAARSNPLFFRANANKYDRCISYGSTQSGTALDAINRYIQTTSP